MDAALKLDGVTKRYGAFTAVSDLSFEVKRGAILGFLGPNGAGKTTTLRMMLGLVAPTRGPAWRCWARPTGVRCAAGSASCPRSAASIGA